MWAGNSYRIGPGCNVVASTSDDPYGVTVLHLAIPTEKNNVLSKSLITYSIPAESSAS
jgi:hypothetical protein